MSIDKNYSVLLSVIYNVQSCKIAPLELESDDKEPHATDDAWFPITEFSPQSYGNKCDQPRWSVWRQEKRTLRKATHVRLDSEPARETGKKQLERQEENVTPWAHSKTEDGASCHLPEG